MNRKVHPILSAIILVLVLMFFSIILWHKVRTDSFITCHSVTNDNNTMVTNERQKQDTIVPDHDVIENFIQHTLTHYSLYQHHFVVASINENKHIDNDIATGGIYQSEMLFSDMSTETATQLQNYISREIEHLGYIYDPNNSNDKTGAGHYIYKHNSDIFILEWSWLVSKNCNSEDFSDAGEFESCNNKHKFHTVIIIGAGRYIRSK